MRNARRRLHDAYPKVNIKLRIEQVRHKANYDRKAVWLSAKAKKLHLNPTLQPK